MEKEEGELSNERARDGWRTGTRGRGKGGRRGSGDLELVDVGRDGANTVVRSIEALEGVEERDLVGQAADVLVRDVELGHGRVALGEVLNLFADVSSSHGRDSNEVRGMA